LLAVLAAEILPIVVLVLVVVIYSFVRSADSPTPEEFAPRAGNWVGPFVGALSVLVFSFLVAKSVSNRPFVHGLCVGLGTAALDFCLGMSMGGGDGSVLAILTASNCGRIIAGVCGGWIGAGRRPV